MRSRFCSAVRRLDQRHLPWPEVQGSEQTFIDDQRRRPQHHQPHKKELRESVSSQEPVFNQNPCRLEKEIEQHGAETSPAGDEIKRYVDDPFVHQPGKDEDEDECELWSLSEPIEDGGAKPVAEPEVPAAAPELTEAAGQDRFVMQGREQAT